MRTKSFSLFGLIFLAHVVAIIEYRGTGWFERWFGHSTPDTTIRSEMEAAGYQLQQQFDFLSRQYFMVFALPSG